MNFIKRIIYLSLSFSLVILLSSWGWNGHKKVSENAPPSFPESLSFLSGNFTTILVDSCVAADDRKEWDYTESPKHYIDIDKYSEFLLNGSIPMAWDSVIQVPGGISFVMSNGTVPWSTIATYDSLRDCFARQDLYKAALFAADLGHYVGDAHNPLHLTTYYDGWDANEPGVHYRYETKMLNAYHDLIVYPFDSAQFIPDVQSFVFSYIYSNYVYVDSVLQADLDATTMTGNVNSSAYIDALWNDTKGFTIPLFHHASFALASLIYTAYVESQHMAINENPPEHSFLGKNFPNPVKDFTIIPFEIDQNNTYVSIKIMDVLGNVRTRLLGEKMAKGHHEIKWDTHGLSDGFYYCVFEADDIISTNKMMVVN
jgi:hypothetical protein